jgi:hypothetical protein
MKKFTSKILTISIVSEVLCKSERSLVWSISSSQKNLWFWTEKKKRVDNMSTIRILRLTLCISNNNSSSTFNKLLICQIWEVSSTVEFLWTRELPQPKLSKKRMMVVGETLLLC